MNILSRCIAALAAIAQLSVPMHASALHAQEEDPRDIATDPEQWDAYNAYLKDPEVGRLLRCAAFLESAATLYFAYGMGELTDLTKRTGATPRMSAAEVEERNAYVLTARALVKQADIPARSLPDYGVWGSFSDKSGEPKSYSVKDFQDTYRDAVRQAGALLKGGVGLQAMAVDGASCFELPDIAALRPRLQARLGTTVPGMEEPASPKIKRGQLPQPLHGYLYKPVAYRYLTCAGIPYVVGTKRFGMMPNPGDPFMAPEATNLILNLSQARLDSADAAAREAHRKAAFDTFEAGLKLMGIKSQEERDSYKYSFRVATEAVERLVNDDLTDDLLAEPVLQCASLPTMAPFLTSIEPAAPAVSLDRPDGFQSWPDRSTGYLAHPVAFRNIFCSALIYAAYTQGADAGAWFAPPWRRDKKWEPQEGDAPAQDEDAAERAAIKSLVYKLYQDGQIDKEAKTSGHSRFSVYAAHSSIALFAAEKVLKDRQGMDAMMHDTTSCFALPEVAPLAEEVRAKVSAWDER